MKSPMKPTSTAILGYDIGGTKIAVCVADESGKVLASARLNGGTQRPYAETIEELLATGKRLVNQAGHTLDDVPVCGISAPGPMDVARGVLEKSPNMAWDDVPIRDDLANGLGIETVLDNDANAGALAEWFFGAGKGAEDLIYLTMSTGIGGGIIAGGQLVRGTVGNAGELGHLILDLDGPPCGCGMKGCFEAYCGGRNVSLRLQRMLKGQPDHPFMKLPQVQGDPGKLNYQTLREAVQAGVPDAEPFWTEICLRMAQGLGMCMMAFNPERIILGTTFYYSGAMLMDPVKQLLPKFVWRQMLDSCALELPALGARIGEMAGIAVACYQRYQEGSWEPEP